MSDETTRETQILEQILEWQEENGLKNWNDDELKYNIGLRISEDIVVSEDAPESDVSIAFEKVPRSKAKYQWEDYRIEEEPAGRYDISRK